MIYKYFLPFCGLSFYSIDSDYFFTCLQSDYSCTCLQSPYVSAYLENTLGVAFLVIVSSAFLNLTKLFSKIEVPSYILTSSSPWHIFSAILDIIRIFKIVPISQVWHDITLWFNCRCEYKMAQAFWKTVSFKSKPYFP